jgi:hypothetical protein
MDDGLKRYTSMIRSFLMGIISLLLKLLMNRILSNQMVVFGKIKDM